MKPVSYQSMPSSVHGGHPNMDHVLCPSKVMYCEKCGFASTDATVFNKHMMEHAGTRFYCFYCNSVSFSQAELNAHLKQHTSKYPFVCPHCGQGYMRRLCLVKHIDRLHGKSIGQGPAKLGMPKAPQVPVCSALTSAPADPAPPRPVVRSPPQSVPAAVRLGKDEQRGKTTDTNVSHVANGVGDRSPFNGLIQHNRALTVSLPEEVSIPAGCLVELVEVKTVNGTKELKLRLVSQQENESVIKDTRTMAPQNLTLGKPLSSALNHPNTARSNSMGTCIVNRKQCEQKAVTVEHPAVVPVNVSNAPPNTVIKTKCGLKRPPQEIINLDSSPVVSNKISKTILSPVRDGNGGARLPTVPVSPKATSSSMASRGVISMLNSTLHPDGKVTGVSQRAVDERKLGHPEHFLSIPPRRPNEPKNVSVAVKVEPGVTPHKSGVVSKAIKETVSMTPQGLRSASPSVSAPVVSAAQIRPQANVVSKDNVVNKPFSLPRTPNVPLSIKSSFLSNYTTSETFSPSQDVKLTELRKETVVCEPESFPVISSVFSLSQQPGDDQGPIKPLVMALRGIVMDKNTEPASPTQNHTKVEKVSEQIDKAPTAGRRSPADAKNVSVNRDPPLTKRTDSCVKIETSDNGIQHPSAPTAGGDGIKEEKKSSVTDRLERDESPGSKSNGEAKSCSSSEEPKTTEDSQQAIKSEQDVSSKYLTVSLKRVQVGVWKKCKKGLKMRISRYKAQVPADGDWTVVHPMPLKVDQPVKRPGPYQPVVVLNHPKPRVSAQGPGTDSLPNADGPEAAPECQILKMRLSKVVGQKYEVMGYTVRVFP